MSGALPKIRVGTGFDVHKLIPGKEFILGGVKIPCEFSLEGHSDADVLLHAITDAVLGALSMGDIGEWFPDTDMSYRGADSREMLERVLEEVRARGWGLGNCDSVVIAERPKLLPYRIEMQESIARIFEVEPNQVGVKATTGEGLGFVGRGEGIAASATVLLIATAK